MEPGAPMDDAPVRANDHDSVDGWLLDHVGNRFHVITYTNDVAAIDGNALAALRSNDIGVNPLL